MSEFTHRISRRIHRLADALKATGDLACATPRLEHVEGERFSNLMDILGDEGEAIAREIERSPA